MRRCAEPTFFRRTHMPWPLIPLPALLYRLHTAVDAIHVAFALHYLYRPR